MALLTIMRPILENMSIKHSLTSSGQSLKLKFALLYLRPGHKNKYSECEKYHFPPTFPGQILNPLTKGRKLPIFISTMPFYMLPHKKLPGVLIYCRLYHECL
jgi:hypothetical protein